MHQGKTETHQWNENHQPELKAQAEALKARVPAARVEIFGDCGHALFVDDAARFNAVLQDFLRAGSISQ